MPHKVLIAALATLVAVGGSTACATKGFVDTRVDEVNTEVNARVDSVERNLEETQAQSRKNSARIDEVDQTASQAVDSAAAANAAAASAGDTATKATDRIAGVEADARRLLFEVVISEDHGEFQFGNAELPDPAKAQIDEMVGRLKEQDKAVWVEIEGHTDSSGSEIYNSELGLARAEAVKRYLHEQHQVPLHKMNVISYGEDKPVGPNTTREGRAQNRRVVIRVLA